MRSKGIGGGFHDLKKEKNKDNGDVEKGKKGGNTQSHSARRGLFGRFWGERSRIKEELLRYGEGGSREGGKPSHLTPQGEKFVAVESDGSEAQRSIKWTEFIYQGERTTNISHRKSTESVLKKGKTPWEKRKVYDNTEN